MVQVNGLNRFWQIPFGLLLVIVNSGVSIGQEPFFSFVDDLWGQGNQRDPYEERLETDRHDFTQSTVTVGRGVAQIETGYSYFYKDQDDEVENAHATPEMLIRLGLTDDIEFRIRYNYIWKYSEPANESGAEDLRFGLKLRATEQSNWIPESAVELLFTVPTGRFTTEQVETGFDFIYGWRLNEKTELYGSSGLFSGGLGDFGVLPADPVNDRFSVFTHSIALGYELTENSAIYNEFFGLFTKGHGENPNPIFYNIGIDYYLSDNAILDFRIGKGLNGDADDLFAGVGGAIRF